MDERESRAQSFLLESWLGLGDVIDDHPEIKKLLFDPVTGLPTTPLLFPRIKSLMEERGEVSLLCVNVVRYSKIEEIYGWRVFDDVMRRVAEALEAGVGSVLRDADIIAEIMISGNSFVVVLSPPRDSDRMDAESRSIVSQRVQASMRERLEADLDPALFKKFGCYVGVSTVMSEENTRLERLVHRGLEMALAASTSREALDAEERVDRLRQIIAEEQVRTLVQPIFELSDMRVIGYEALSRGPEGTEFERPDKLFHVAYDADLVIRLERLCRKKALEAAHALPEGRLLFMNIEPGSMADPDLRRVFGNGDAEKAPVPADRIVLEITERTAIVDFCAFRSTLEYVRALGFEVAIDDAGAGYGSLQCLAEVRPEWLKIDISLVRGCDTDEVRSQLIASLVAFAQTMEVNLIAEGIETTGELECVRALGVQYGQGFLMSYPVPPFPADDELKHLGAL